MLESELRNHHIEWITNARTTKVEEGKLFVEELNEDGGSPVVMSFAITS